MSRLRGMFCVLNAVCNAERPEPVAIQLFTYMPRPLLTSHWSQLAYGHAQFVANTRQLLCCPVCVHVYVCDASMLSKYRYTLQVTLDFILINRTSLCNDLSEDCCKSVRVCLLCAV